MRTSKKESLDRQRQNRDFERLYRTIPQNYQSGSDVSAANEPDDIFVERPSEGKLRRKKLIKRVVIIFIILLALTGLWLGAKFAANIIKVFGWGGITDIFRTEKLRGEDEGRVTFLLAGNSADDPGHGGAELTDSIMLVSMNTKEKTGYILSIPRDLYVDIPGHGYAKINEAYQDGKRAKFSEPDYAQGGMGLLEKTVSQYFGVKINYYALVNYTALEQAVNAVGGVRVDIQSTDPRGIYDPSLDLQTRKPLVKLPNGPNDIDGRTALNLARARGNGRGSYGYAQSDFTRTENQRKILIGLKDKATSASTLSNPVKLSQLFDSFGNNLETDLKTSEVRRAYDLSKEIPSSTLKSVSLNKANGEDLLMSYSTRTGQSALVPKAGIDNYSVIQTFISGL